MSRVRSPVDRKTSAVLDAGPLPLSVCGSNQHQIALAVTQFAGDHFDLLPREGISPWYERPRVGANIPWIEATRPYLVSRADKGDLRSPVYLDPAHPNPNHSVHCVVNGITGRRTTSSSPTCMSAS